jgi:DNA (cytosine-5)-methyltransferase 1
MAVVERLGPSVVLIENVPELPSWDDGAVIVGFYESLRTLGYEVDARILDAFQHGVPQHRARLFIVATRGVSGFEWPEPRSPAPTLRDAIADLPPAPAAQRDERSLYFDSPRSTLAKRMRLRMTGENRRVVWDHMTRDVRADDLEAFNLMPQGGTYSDLPAKLQRYRTDIFTDKYKRLVWDQVSRSITAHIAKDGYWYIHPGQPRTLSIREAARIQTFPDDFRFAGQPSHRLRQIGNAVPPLLAEAIGVQIRGALEAPEEVSRRDGFASFHHDLRFWHDDHERGFPWRAGGSSAWFVLMAEMCLHRANADRVAATFESLTALAPTPGAMVALGEEAQVRMRALGLGQRAEALGEVARAVVADFDGEVPSTEIELRSLPAVGDYVAQAVLCFAFGRRAVLVDTSTSRITGRLFGRSEKRRWQLRLDLYRLAGPQGPDAAFNHSLLDLGALVCVIGEPHCASCPVRGHCMTGDGTPPPSQLELEAVH